MYHTMQHAYIFLYPWKCGLANHYPHHAYDLVKSLYGKWNSSIWSSQSCWDLMMTPLIWLILTIRSHRFTGLNMRFSQLQLTVVHLLPHGMDLWRATLTQQRVQ